jgi:hypothetical protein
MSDISGDDAEQINALVFTGRRIEAIKIYRKLSGKDLKESKDFVDALEAELRVSCPEQFTVPPGGKGCGTAVLCLLILIPVAVLLVGN